MAQTLKMSTGSSRHMNVIYISFMLLFGTVGHERVTLTPMQLDRLTGLFTVAIRTLLDPYFQVC